MEGQQPDNDEKESFHIPTSDEDASSEETESDVAMAPEILAAPEADRDTMRGQAMHFARVEKWARMLNGTLTPYEKHVLMESVTNLPESLIADVKKLIANYGREHGPGAACRRLLRYFAKQEKVAVGVYIPPENKMFTLCKHLLLADRQTEALLEDETCVGCSCLSETYFMPEGCRHRKLSLYKDRFLPTTLCGTCSRCMRCNKLLD